MNRTGWATALAIALVAGCAQQSAGGPKAPVVTNDNVPVANRNPHATSLVAWPKPTGEQEVGHTIRVKGTFDGGMKRFYGVDELATNDQDEHQGAIFDLAPGSTLSNVILGDPAADGVHCQGVCTLNNVWWERVGEDAATFRGMDDGEISVVNGGGASGARDKVFQHNGGGTVHIKNFYVEQFGKLYRSCGNCKGGQVRRGVIVENVTAVVGPRSKTLVGVNANYGDSAEFRGVTRIYDKVGKMKTVCLRYEGNARGMPPRELKDMVGPDDKYCHYSDQTVIVQRGDGRGPAPSDDGDEVAADAVAPAPPTSKSP